MSYMIITCFSETESALFVTMFFDKDQQQYYKYLVCVLCEKHKLDINLNITFYLKECQPRKADLSIIVLSG